jgi:type II secretion system protein H
MKRRPSTAKISDTSKPGFTLVELMVVIAIIAIIASFTFAEINTASYRLKTVAHTMKAHLMQAKLEAVKKGQKVWLTINSTKDGYSIMTADSTGTASTLKVIRYPGKFTFTSANKITFTPLGTATPPPGTANPNNITIVNQGTTEPEYKISVNNIGSIKIEKTKN